MIHIFLLYAQLGQSREDIAVSEIKALVKAGE
ncbi:MAG: hypothetical protein C5S49_00105 [Candidatus Methanogaster sp.]|nr:MAG: hypothetical protein C5S49_00105 [ANME-2 cluster archaeon]